MTEYLNLLILEGCDELEVTFCQNICVEDFAPPCFFKGLSKKNAVSVLSLSL